MPNLTTETLEEVFAQYMPTVLVPLIRYEGFDNSGNTVEYRYVANWEDVVSNGETYSAAAFRISLGSDDSENMPTISLTYDAGDRQVVSELREFDEAPKIYMSAVVAERPDVVEIPEMEFEVKEWTLKDSTVNITLEAEPVLNEAIVGDIVTPNIFPLLWENVTVAGQ